MQKKDNFLGFTLKDSKLIRSKRAQFSLKKKTLTTFSLMAGDIGISADITVRGKLTNAEAENIVNKIEDFVDEHSYIVDGEGAKPLIELNDAESKASLSFPYSNKEKPLSEDAIYTALDELEEWLKNGCSIVKSEASSKNEEDNKDDLEILDEKEDDKDTDLEILDEEEDTEDNSILDEKQQTLLDKSSDWHQLTKNSGGEVDPKTASAYWARLGIK